MTQAEEKVHLTKDHALELMRQMVLIRRFEETCAELYSAGKIRGFLHLYIGEEANAVGVMQALSPDDAVVRSNEGPRALSRRADGHGAHGGPEGKLVDRCAVAAAPHRHAAALDLPLEPPTDYGDGLRGPVGVQVAGRQGDLAR